MPGRATRREIPALAGASLRVVLFVSARVYEPEESILTMVTSKIKVALAGIVGG